MGTFLLTDGVCSYSGMGNLLDLITESPALTDGTE